MPLYYYQVTGWRSHVTRLPDSNIPRPTDQVAHILWDYLAEDGLLTLTLGILPCGASYLLTPATRDMNRELQRLFTGRAYPATRFAALSPVEFRDVQTLRAKLDRHQQKSKKSKRHEPDRDLSQANTHYTTGREPDVLTSEGRDRVMFEYHRLFYRLCRASIDSEEYDIKRVPFFDNIRAYSLAYTVHIPSQWRHLDERRRNPVLLDLGYAEWILPASSMDMTAVGGDYYKIKENSRLKNPGVAQGAYLYGEGQEATQQDLRERLPLLFDRKLDAPIMLFVHNAEEAMDVLRFYGVDTTGWTTAFEPLVGKDVLRVGERYPPDDRAKAEGERGRYTDRYHGRPTDRHGDRHARERTKFDRSRSRSPRRDAHTPRPRSPPPRGNAHPVYVVDVAHLYATMRRIPIEPSLTVASLADDLEVALEQPEGTAPFTAGQWCAGNECRLVALIWQALVRGNAIDDQLLCLQARPARAPVRHVAQAPPAAPAPAAGGWDDDADPNDILAAPRPAGQRPSDPYDDFENDDFEED